MARVTLLALLALPYLTTSVRGQCQPRNLAASNAVNRPCTKRCSGPGDARCREDKQCVCDHECGYSCIRLDKFCETPPSIPNMARVQVSRRSNGALVPLNSLSYRYDDVAEYTCLPGYKRDFPIMQHFCHGRKGWTGRTTCVLSCQPYNRREVIRNNMICGSQCTADSDCDRNSTCICDGPCGQTCVSNDVDCGGAPPSENASITYRGEGFYKVADYTCEDGYFISSGDFSRKCTGGGTWEGELISCERITCGDPSQSIARTGGHIVSGQSRVYYVGHVVRFGCFLPKKLLGSENRTCKANGQWSGELAICDSSAALRCNHPGVPINGILLGEGDFSEKSVVEFECESGFALVGDRRQHCLYFLQWSGDGAPKCIDPRVPVLTSEAVRYLQESTKNIQASLQLTNAGFSSSSQTAANLDAFFIIDISSSVRNKVLNDSLDFAINRVLKLARGGSIRCTVVVFASSRKVLLGLGTYSARKVVETLGNIFLDKENIASRIGYRRNTEVAIRSLSQTLHVSFTENKNRQRIAYLLINGMHNRGSPPTEPLNRLVTAYEDNPPEIYVVAYGREHANGRAYEELQSLAFPNKLFLINPKVELLVESTNDTSPKDKECGKAGDVDSLKKQANPGFVLGGKVAKAGAWPWHAVITRYHVNTAQTFVNLRGGGCLLNHQWVLTAAHLFDDILKVNDWSRAILVVLGLHTLPQSDSERLPQSSQAYDAETILSHERFSGTTFDFDIALIKLGNPFRQLGYEWVQAGSSAWVKYTPYVSPVCLPCVNSCAQDFLENAGLLSGKESQERQCEIAADYLLQRDRRVEKSTLTAVVGFGATTNITAYDKAVPSVNLKQGLIRMQSDIRCSHGRDAMVRRGLDQRIVFTDNMVCGVGGNPNTADACKGDSGGGFVRELKNLNTKESCWVQIGIVSWGWGCGQKYTLNEKRVPFPGFYTNVLPFTSWIKHRINQDTPPCVRDLSLVEPGRKCKKECRIDADCKGGKKRCRCDDACGMSCYNPVATCRPLPPFTNGNTKIKGGGIYGSTVTYTCNDNFILHGPAVRKCRSDRRWSGEQSECRAINCRSPLPPRFGSLSSDSDTLVGGSITFRCNDGFAMAGYEEDALRTTCLADGTWTRATPECIEVRCDVRAPPEFGRVSTDLNRIPYGKSIVYSCDNKHRLVGRRAVFLSVKCLRDGRWSADVPRCADIECVVPLPPRFGTVSSSEASLLLDEVITFRCNPRYKLVGHESDEVSATCLRDGTWDVAVPECNVITCGVPDDLLEFVVVSTNRRRLEQDETFTYTCDGGTRMVGQPTGRLRTTCQEDSTWSVPVPHCAEITCLVPDPPEFGRVSRRGSLKVGEEVIYTCLANYKMVGNDRGQVAATCRRDGVWTAGVPQCIERTCNAPAPPRFGSVSRNGAVPVNQQVTYRCGDGYTMVNRPRGVLTVTCLRDGRWSIEPPTCEEDLAVQCRIPRSTTEKTVPTGARLTYTCPDQFEMVRVPGGQVVSSCRADGTWSAPAPICRGLGCTKDRNKCAFPFVYKGHYYTSCTTVDQARGIQWCSKTPTMTKYFGACVQCNVASVYKISGVIGKDPTSQCVGSLTATATPAVLTSPNFPNNYDNNLNCHWIIRSGSTSSQVGVEVNSHVSERCCDHLRISDGTSPNSGGLVVIRGHSTGRFKAISTFGALYVSFHSDESNTYRGFQLTYRTYNYNNCGGELRASAIPQTLSSPNYPANYPDDVYCKWIITAPPGKQVRLTMTTMVTEICCDGIMIFDGVTDDASLYFHARGNVTASSPAVSTGGKILVRFRSDGATNAKGFTGTYQSVPSPATSPTPSPNPVCGGSRNVPPVGYDSIKMRSGPSVGRGPFNCIWTLYAPPGHQVRVWFSFISFKNVWCKVLDGSSANSPKLGAFTSSPSFFFSYVSTNGVLRLVLQADPIRNAETFHAFYEVHVPGGDQRTSTCGGRITATSSLQFISTPNWPDAYPSNSRCTWVLYSGGKNKYVYLHILGILVENSNDKLEIYDGNLKRRLISVGGRLNHRITAISKTSYLSVLFTSNEKTNFGGFRAAYEAKSQPHPSDLLFN